MSNQPPAPSAQPPSKPQALLLLGPTGSGKSPLGDYLAEHGWQGRRCFHFDFGHNLRKAAEHGFDNTFLTKDDVNYIHDMLLAGTLLENETFYIAAHLLDAFMSDSGAQEDDVIVMNGLPRHIGQAEEVDNLVDMQLVINLECSPETVMERIATNSGGDREGRVDDSKSRIVRKLEIFHERTVPLLDHYRHKNVRIYTFDVGVTTTPADIIGGDRGN
ncbi:hypothetical protein BVX97_06590 [bacterium E08(2017)]|nr:hypothetical protein BVX97_06590 [bacterium E08(2017)]